MIEDNGVRRARELLHERDALGVVLPLDRRVVIERSVRRRLGGVLEPGRIERGAFLLPAEVLFRDGVRNVALGA